MHILAAEVCTFYLPNRIAVLDIGVTPHGNQRLEPLYERFRALKATTSCSLVIVRSALSPQLTNIGLVDGQPIVNADDSLRDTVSVR